MKGRVALARSEGSWTQLADHRSIDRIVDGVAAMCDFNLTEDGAKRNQIPGLAPGYGELRLSQPRASSLAIYHGRAIASLCRKSSVCKFLGSGR
jgi:hypothetical protein